MYDGIINVYKEKGFTSHDVVAKMRGILGQRKIGHTGTLDPEAEGVLPVCAGKGTKLCDMLTDHDKIYRAVLLLGTETDTEDTTGTVLETKDTSGLTENEVRDAVCSFIGDYDRSRRCIQRSRSMERSFTSLRGREKPWSGKRVR